MTQKLEYIKFVTLNKIALSESTECACVYCFRKYHPNEITEWCQDFDPIQQKMVDDTAICPFCSVDAIIPNSLIKYADDDLKKWHEQGFGNIESKKNFV